MSKKKTPSKQSDSVEEDVADNEEPAEEAAVEDPVAEEAVTEEPVAKPAEESRPEPAVTTGKKTGTGIIAWLALLLAAVALVAIGLDVVQDRSDQGDTAQSDAQLRNLMASVAATQDVMASLEQSVSALSELDSERNAAIERIGRQLNDRLRQIESLPGRVATIEASMASLQGISTGARDAWLLAEAEYYMQIANAQLQLANNPELAMLALTHADDRIVQLGDPRLTNIRQALANELRALDAMEKPDTAGITLTLASLAATVDSLPLKQESVTRDEAASAEVEPDLTGMDRAMASLMNAVDGVVSVRRTDEAMQPLIAPEALYFLRANLGLQLQAARLALLRGEETVFRQSLDDADAWLAEHYDQNSTAVKSARVTVAGIRGSVFSVAVPDISQSLRLLRQFNTLARAAGNGGNGTSRDETAADDEAGDAEDPEQDQ